MRRTALRTRTPCSRAHWLERPASPSLPRRCTTGTDGANGCPAERRSSTTLRRCRPSTMIQTTPPCRSSWQSQGRATAAAVVCRPVPGEVRVNGKQCLATTRSSWPTSPPVVVQLASYPRALRPRPGTSREPFNFTPVGVNSISFGPPHVRCTPMGRTCGEPGEINDIKKNTTRKISPLLCVSRTHDASTIRLLKRQFAISDVSSIRLLKESTLGEGGWIELAAA